MFIAAVFSTHVRGDLASGPEDYVIVSGSQTKAIAANAQQRVKSIAGLKGILGWDADEKTLDALNNELIKEAQMLSATYGSWAVNTIPTSNFSLKNVAFKNSIPNNTAELRAAAFNDLSTTRLLLNDDRNKARTLAKKKTTNTKFQDLRAEIEQEFSTLLAFVEHIMVALLVFDPGLQS